MTEPQRSYAANREEVAAKVIDGELIIIRLADGTYYSMDSVGAQLWELLDDQHDLPTIARTIASWYGTPVHQVERDVGKLVEDLLSEGLIVPAAARPRADGAPPPAELLPYEAPQLNIYRDMGNLLALDPPTPGIDDLLFRDAPRG
jgi:hypothetical protein